jgi:hypothetical protein
MVHSLAVFLPAQAHPVRTSMALLPPNRTHNRTPSGFHRDVTLECHLGNSSTRVLYGHPLRSSTFVLYAAAPASLVESGSGRLSLRTGNRARPAFLFERSPSNSLEPSVICEYVGFSTITTL